MVTVTTMVMETDTVAPTAEATAVDIPPAEEPLVERHVAARTSRVPLTAACYYRSFSKSR